MRSRSARGLPAVAVAVAWALATIAPERADAGACGRSSLSVELLAGAGSTFSRGIVVALSTGGTLGDAPDDADDGAASFRIGAALERGEDRIALRAQSIAPGLALLVPETRARVGRWTLRTRTGSEPVIVRAGPVPPAPRAPAPTSARHTQAPTPVVIDQGTSGGIGGSRGYTPQAPPPVVSIELAEPAGDVIAVIAYAVRGTTETPISWARVGAGARQLSFAGSAGGRCVPPMRFLDAPPHGSHLRLAWVDADGRVSERSPVTIVER